MATTNSNAVDPNTPSTTTTTTTTTNPLHIPEIVAQLGLYLSGTYLINALLVNHTWYSALLPSLWLSIQLPSHWALEHNPHCCPSNDSVRRNCHSIRFLSCLDLLFVDALIPDCKNLIELNLSIISLKTAVILHQNANSLQSLTRQANVRQPRRHIGLQHKLFAAIASLVRLEHLRLERLQVHRLEGKDFLKTCQRLVSLHLSNFIWNLPDPCTDEFPTIQQLTLIKNKTTPMQDLEFAARCPNLKFFRWHTVDSLFETQLSVVQDLLHTRLRHLRTVAIPYSALSDEDVAAIITALPALVNLHARSSEFGRRATQAIVEFKNGIQELDICNCGVVSSDMIQAILSTCKDLEAFGGDVFDIQDLPEMEGGGWACRHLKKMQISIMTSGGKESRTRDHERMYDQLAKLTELTVLDLGTTGMATRYTYDWMELKLSSGFGRLSPLRGLEDFTVGRVYPPLGEEEREWVREHWPTAEVH
ncbi:hypothetical protein BGZ58_006884 [Dissophora ornata]|nr:hypothetical protein BGZ58_006884 [Dissophora ornata]